jgi:mRNA interferase RelE/StbE
MTAISQYHACGGQSSEARSGCQAQASILSYLRQRVQGSENPRQLGKALHGDKQGLWRYRVGKHLIICDIQDKTLTVLVLAVAHRKDVYR